MGLRETRHCSVSVSRICETDKGVQRKFRSMPYGFCAALVALGPLPGLTGVAVRALHSGGHRREEHEAALAAVGGSIEGAAGLAHTLHGWIALCRGGGSRLRRSPRGLAARPCAGPAAARACLSALAQRARDALAEGFSAAGSHDLPVKTRLTREGFAMQGLFPGRTFYLSRNRHCFRTATAKPGV